MWINAIISAFALLNLALAIAGQQLPRSILIALLVAGVCAFVSWIVSLMRLTCSGGLGWEWESDRE